MPSFDRALDRLSTRNWAQIRELWVPHLPAISPAGASPRRPLSQFEPLASIIGNVPNDGEWRSSIDDLETEIFREGIFLLHKSSRVLAAAETHILNGLPSWSLASGYHAALYAANAILRFLGVSAVYFNPRTILVDVWPGPRKGSKQQARRYQRGTEQQLIPASSRRLDQYQWWEIFDAVVEGAEVQLWDRKIIDAILAIDARSFGRQRNDIIYKSEHWPLADLFSELDLPKFGRRESGKFTAINFSLSDSDFSIVIGFILHRLAFKLLTDLLPLSPVLTRELALMQSCLTDGSHTIYGATSL